MNQNILLFDLGGVLFDLGDPVAAMGLRMNNDQFWAQWLSSPLVRAYETGKLSSDEFVAQFGAELGFDLDANFSQKRRRKDAAGGNNDSVVLQLPVTVVQ